MSLYLEQIRQLVALQRVDDAIHSVEMELEQAPKELEDLKNRFAATNTQRERVLEKLAHLKEQEKRITGELDDDSSRIKKSKNKMMQVSNSREYQAYTYCRAVRHFYCGDMEQTLYGSYPESDGQYGKGEPFP